MCRWTVWHGCKRSHGVLQRQLSQVRGIQAIQGLSLALCGRLLPHLLAEPGTGQAMLSQCSRTIKGAQAGTCSACRCSRMHLGRGDGLGSVHVKWAFGVELRPTLRALKPAPPGYSAPAPWTAVLQVQG